MLNADLKKDLYCFGSFRLDPIGGSLQRDGNPIPVSPKAFEILVALVQNSGRVLTKDELMSAVWPDTFVDEINLTVHISALRKALGDKPDTPEYIATVPRQGYSFVASVIEKHQDDANIRSEPIQDSASPYQQEDSPVAEGNHEKTRPERGWAEYALRAVAIVLVVAGCAIYLWPRRSGAGQQIKSIAVLPFKPFGTDDKYDQLGLGMMDALITRLSNVRKIVVRPTSAVLRANTTERDSGALARSLGVDSFLEGRIQAAGGRVRLSVQLVRTTDGVPIWAETFDQRASDLFALQDSVAERVANSLVLRLTGEEKASLSKRYTESDEAHLAYIRGRYFWDKRTPDGLKKAMDCFNQAIEADPSYALAYAGLADCYVLVPFYTFEPANDAVPKAKEAALKALEIDENIAEAHASLAYARFIYDWDWPGAEAELKRSLELNPNYPTAHHWYADYLAAMGRPQEAIPEMQHAVALDPLSLIMNTDLGWVLYSAGRYDDAIVQLQKTIEMQPAYPPAHWTLGKAYEAKGMYAEAIAEFQKNGNDKAELGRALALSGRKDEALRIIDGLKHSTSERPAPKLSIGLLYCAVGDNGHAMTWLERALQEREHRLVYLKFDPNLGELRSDARFLDLMHRIGLS
jgi:DNA-binding winged helix-turn-helix (wHTH) protein/TolB-like protein/Tfp pilus assembly protein PilF